MRRPIGRAVLGLTAAGILWPAVGRADDAASEPKRLEGVWASKPPAKGRGRGHVLYIQGGKVGWESFQTRDGEPVIGHAKLYELAVDPKAAPRHITLTRGEGEDRETRLGVYELDGDTLKVAFGVGKDMGRPKGVAAEGAETLVLTRDKAAKLPKLDQPRGKEVRVSPSKRWDGTFKDAETNKKLPDEPVTTWAEFEKVWKALRGDERVPDVDFDKAFALVHTFPGFKVKDLGLVLKPSGGVSMAISADPGAEKVDGFTYIIAVFGRDVVDVAGDQLVPKKGK